MANDIPFARLARFVPRRLRYPLVLKAVSFGLIGFVNAGVDAGVFFLARALLNTSSAAGAASAALAAGCACAAPETPITIAANVLSWMVAVTGSYVMNSSITFAAESGRTLRWRDYRRFALSGVAGLVANTGALVMMDDFLPIWGAKLCAILVGFVVNFGLTHFIVFRAQPERET